MEGADSNDTATVAVARDGTAAIGEEEGDLRIELVERDAVATNAAAPAVEATRSETNVLGNFRKPAPNASSRVSADARKIFRSGHKRKFLKLTAFFLRKINFFFKFSSFWRARVLL